MGTQGMHIEQGRGRGRECKPHDGAVCAIPGSCLSPRRFVRVCGAQCVREGRKLSALTAQHQRLRVTLEWSGGRGGRGGEKR